jgi:hypothetical protein
MPLNRAVARIRGNPQRAEEISRFGKSETCARIRGKLKPLLEPLREYGKLLGRIEHSRTALILVHGEQKSFSNFSTHFSARAR